jgi:hypothetical protein
LAAACSDGYFDFVIVQPISAPLVCSVVHLYLHFLVVCILMPADQLASRAGWSSQRCERVLAELLKEGMTMIDDGAPDKVRLYWFPALTPQQPQPQ